MDVFHLGISPTYNISGFLTSKCLCKQDCYKTHKTKMCYTYSAIKHCIKHVQWHYTSALALLSTIQSHTSVQRN